MELPSVLRTCHLRRSSYTLFLKNGRIFPAVVERILKVSLHYLLSILAISEEIFYYTSLSNAWLAIS
jgi:hypothetical protein